MADIDKEDFEQFQELPNNLKKAVAAAADLKRVIIDASDMANALAASFGKVARSMEIGSSEMKKSLKMSEDILKNTSSRSKAELMASAQLGTSLKKLLEIRDIKAEMFKTEQSAMSGIYTKYSKQVALSSTDLANRQSISNISKQMSAEENASATEMYQKNAAINLQLQQRSGLIKDESVIMSQNVRILSEQSNLQTKFTQTLNDSVISIKSINFSEQIKSQSTLLYQATKTANSYKNQNSLALTLNKQQIGLIMSAKELGSAYENIEKKLTKTTDSANTLTSNIRQSNIMFDTLGKSAVGITQSVKDSINAMIGLGSEAGNTAAKYNSITKESANVKKHADQVNAATETIYTILNKSSAAAFDLSKQFVSVKKESYGVLENIVGISSKTDILYGTISKISTVLSSKYDIPLKLDPMIKGMKTFELKSKEAFHTYGLIASTSKTITASEKSMTGQVTKRKAAYASMFKPIIADGGILSKYVKYIDDMLNKSKLKIVGMVSNEKERLGVLKSQQAVSKNLFVPLVEGSKLFGKETKANINNVDKLSNALKTASKEQKEITTYVRRQKELSASMLRPLIFAYNEILTKANELKDTTLKLATDIKSIGSDNKTKLAVEGLNKSAKSMRLEYSQTSAQSEKLSKVATQTSLELSKSAETTSKVANATSKFSDKLSSVKSNISEVSKKTSSAAIGMEAVSKKSSAVSAVLDVVKKSSGFVSTNVSKATDKMSQLARVVPTDGMNAVVGFSSKTLDLVSKTHLKMAQASIESKSLGSNIGDINRQANNTLKIENDINERLKLSTSLNKTISGQSLQIYNQQNQTSNLREQELVQLNKSNDLVKTTYLNQKNVSVMEKSTIGQIVKHQDEQTSLNALKQQALENEKKYYINHFNMSKLMQSDEKTMSVGLVLRSKQLLDLRSKYKGVNDVAGMLPNIWEKIQSMITPVAANTMPNMINVSKVLGGEFSAINDLVAGISNPMSKILQSLFGSSDAANSFELSWVNIFTNLVKAKDAGKLFEQVMTINKDRSLDVKEVFDQINDVLGKSKGGLADFFAPLEKSAKPVAFFRDIAAHMLKFSKTASGAGKFLAPLAGFGASLFKVFGLVAKWAGPIGLVVNAVQVAWSIGKKFISTLTEGGGSIGSAIVDALAYIPKAIYDTLLKPFVSAIESVAELFGIKIDIVGALKKMALGIMNIGSKMFAPIFQAWESLSENFVGENGLGKKIYNGVSSFGQMIYGAITKPISSAWELVTGWFDSFPTKLFESISSGAKSIASIAFGIVTNPFKMAMTLIGGLFGASGELKNVIVGGLKAIGSYIYDSISAPFKAVMDMFGNTNQSNRSFVGAGDVTKQAVPTIQATPITASTELETGELRDAIRELTAAVNNLRTSTTVPTATAAAAKLDTTNLEAKLDTMTTLLMSGAIRVYLDGKDVSSAMAGIGR